MSMRKTFVSIKNQEQLKAVPKAPKMEFETRKSPYDPQFIEKIEKGEQEFKEGKYSSISLNEVVFFE